MRIYHTFVVSYVPHNSQTVNVAMSLKLVDNIDQ